MEKYGKNMEKYGKHLEKYGKIWKTCGFFSENQDLNKEKYGKLVCVYDQRLVKWGFNMQLLWCTVLKNCNYRL